MFAAAAASAKKKTKDDFSDEDDYEEEEKVVAKKPRGRGKRKAAVTPRRTTPARKGRKKVEESEDEEEEEEEEVLPARKQLRQPRAASLKVAKYSGWHDTIIMPTRICKIKFHLCRFWFRDILSWICLEWSMYMSCTVELLMNDHLD